MRTHSPAIFSNLDASLTEESLPISIYNKNKMQFRSLPSPLSFMPDPLPITNIPIYPDLTKTEDTLAVLETNVYNIPNLYMQRHNRY